MLVSPHMKILKHLLDIVNLIHMQCLSLAVVNDSNVKNFLCLFQVLDFEDCSKKLLESCYSWGCCEDYNNVINIEKQYDVFLTVKQETWVSITLMKLNLDKFSNTSFMSVFCDLLEFIQTLHYVQCTVLLWSRGNWLKLWVSTDEYTEQAHSRNLGLMRLKCQDCWVGQLKNLRNSTGLTCQVWWVSLYIDRINFLMKLIMFNF